MYFSLAVVCGGYIYLFLPPLSQKGWAESVPSQLLVVNGGPGWIPEEWVGEGGHTARGFFEHYE